MADAIDHFKLERGTDGVTFLRPPPFDVDLAANVREFSDDTPPATSPTKKLYYRLTAITDAAVEIQYNVVRVAVGGALNWQHVLNATVQPDTFGACPRYVKSDSQNNLIVVGNFKGSVDFGDGVLRVATNAVGSFSSSLDIFIVKYNSAGVLVWFKQFGNAGKFSSANSVTIDGSDNIIVSGGFLGTINFGGDDLTSGNFTGTQNKDAFVVKYTAAGSHVWSFAIGADYGQDVGISAATDSAGNVFVGGQTQVDDLVIAGVPVAGAASLTAFFLKFNSSGVFQWKKTFTGTGLVQGGIVCIATNSDGSVIFGSSYKGTINFGTGNKTSGNSGAALNGFFIKCAADGSVVWVNTWPSSSGTFCNGVAVNPVNDEIVVIGSVGGNTDFGLGEIPWDNQGQSASGAIAYARYTADGVNLSNRLIGSGGGRSIGIGVSFASNGVFAITGALHGFGYFDYPNGFSGSTRGVPEYFVAVYNADNSLRWFDMPTTTPTATTPGSSVSCSPSGDVLTAQGYIDSRVGVISSYVA